MRPYLLASLVVACAATPLAAQGDTAAATQTALGFEIGETLIYEAKFGFISLGSGMMNVDRLAGSQDQPASLR